MGLRPPLSLTACKADRPLLLFSFCHSLPHGQCTLQTLRWGGSPGPGVVQGLGHKQLIVRLTGECSCEADSAVGAHGGNAGKSRMCLGNEFTTN